MKYDAILADLRRHGNTIVGPPEVMSAAENPGARVGRHVVVAQLGQGGAGTVYRAWDPGPGRFVALKVLNRDTPAVLERFKREAQIAARLRHPGIVPVHEVGEDAGRHFIAMELIDGTTADARRMRPREAADVVRQAALAIHAAHEQGVIHRDVKPSNILIDKAGRAYVSDFGLARWVEASRSLTDSDMVMGTPGFMSPEQVRDTKRVDPRTDVYSLGATLYRLSTGRVPHAAATTFETLKRTLEEELAMPRGVLPRDLEAVIQVAMAKEVQKRYATARALAEDLKRYLDGDPVAAHPPSFGYRMSKRLAKRKLVVGLAAIVALLAIVLGVVVPQWRAKSEELALQAELRPVEEAIKYARPYLYAATVDPSLHMRRVDDALRGLETLMATSRDERRPEVWTMLGMGWHFLGDDAAAERALLRAVALARDDPRANYALARIYLERSVAVYLAGAGVTDRERKRRGREWAEKARGHLQRIEPGWFEVPELDRTVARACVALSAGDDQGVLRVCEEGLARFGTQAGTEEFHAVRGVVRSRPEDRIADYSQALKLRPHFAWAAMMRGIDHLQLGQWQAAIIDLDRALHLNPRLGAAYNARGVAREMAGDLDEAHEDQSRAIRLDPGLVEPWIARAAVRYKRGDIEGAYADVELALRMAPDVACALANRAAIRVMRGELAAAIADYDRAIGLEPGVAKYHLGRAIARTRAGELAAALNDYDTALKLEPGEPRYRVERAHLRSAMDDIDGALAELTEVLAAHPRSDLAYHTRGMVRQRRRDFEGAIQDYTAAVAIQPRLPQSYVNRGICRANLGDSAGAVADFEAAMRVDEKHAEAYACRGLMRERAGDSTGAATDLRRALEFAAPGWERRRTVEEALTRVTRR